MEDRLIAYLQDDTDVTTLLGSRMYPDTLPQGATLPALVYQRIDTPRTHVHGEASVLPRPRIQMHFWATTLAKCWEAADAVRKCLDGYRGEIDDITVCRIVILSEWSTYEPETGLRSVIQDYQVTYLDPT